MTRFSAVPWCASRDPNRATSRNVQPNVSIMTGSRKAKLSVEAIKPSRRDAVPDLPGEKH
ncbi:hypothetical protein AB3480_18930 [Rhizobium mongolense]|uniref:hypothetical protein n=1 Tax=Rhizobium mongolense TaxID=57676 RepID=UPI0034A36D0E